jgi:hypothetical protein
VSLLVAALLYFCGVAVGPVAHMHGANWSTVPAFTHSGPDTGSPAPQSELGCFVCQALGAHAVPSSGTPTPAAAVRASVPLPDPDPVAPSPRSSTSHARAPPLA